MGRGIPKRHSRCLQTSNRRRIMFMFAGVCAGVPCPKALAIAGSIARQLGAGGRMSRPSANGSSLRGQLSLRRKNVIFSERCGMRLSTTAQF